MPGPGRPRTLAAILVVVGLAVAAVAVGIAAAGQAHQAPAAKPQVSVFPARTPQPRGRADALNLVALGDSVTSGAACGCQPFPTVYGHLLSQRYGVAVHVVNDGVDGLDSGGLLAQVRQQPVSSQVAAADVVVVTIGANDFGDHHDDVTAGACGFVRGDCVSDELETMRRNVTTLLDLVHRPRTGRPTTVLVTGYWNVFEDGEVAQESFPEAGREATMQLTRRTNAALKADAERAGATYVDLMGPFEDHPGGVEPLLAPDGDHPDARGHDLIARTLLAAGLPGSTWPVRH